MAPDDTTATATTRGRSSNSSFVSKSSSVSNCGCYCNTVEGSGDDSKSAPRETSSRVLSILVPFVEVCRSSSSRCS